MFLQQQGVAWLGGRQVTEEQHMGNLNPTTQMISQIQTHCRGKGWGWGVGQGIEGGLLRHSFFLFLPLPDFSSLGAMKYAYLFVRRLCNNKKRTSFGIKVPHLSLPESAVLTSGNPLLRFIWANSILAPKFLC